MREEIQEFITEACRELYGVKVDVELTRPEEQFGDYSTNIALQLTGRVGKKPRDIAEELTNKLGKVLGEKAASVELAGPGFINITLSDKALIELAETEPARPLEGKKVLVEYSDPNPLKPLHAGHLYTTLVGDSIARLVENAGAETIRLNFGGDVGMHVAKSMWGIIRYLGGESPEKLDNIPKSEQPAWLGERYVEGSRAYKDNPSAKAEITAINKRVYEIHDKNDHDSPFAEIYWTCREWSYSYFKSLYERLEVKPFDRYIPESEVSKPGLEAVKNHIEKGVYEESDGAVIFDGEKYGLHKRVFINSEGLPTYETKDVGLSLTKWNDYKFDESIIITATEQAEYMKVVIKSIEQFAPEPARRTKHLTHGTVKLSGGLKMSSREGNIVSAIEILDAATKAGEESGVSSDRHTILAAVKYAFSKNRIGSDIVYDPKESIALEGNSGPYLQYAHARAASILRKALNKPPDRAYSVSLNDSERSLFRKIGEYSEVVEQATGELMPHVICTYLYELAQKFNRFYEKNKVIGSDQELARLRLVRLYKKKLADGLRLLGIHAPDKM